MSFLEGLAELIAPTRCAGCDLPGALLCEGCRSVAMRFEHDQSCPRCAAPYGALVCTECWNSAFAFERAIALGELDHPLGRAVVLFKDSGERRLGPLLGELLAAEVARQWQGWADVVAWVPPTPAARARRGFDHARAMAEPIAAALGVPLCSMVTRRQARDQRVLGRSARAANAAETFVISDDPPARVLLVDDVLTTGATLDAAASVILAAGALEVRAAVVARAW